MSGRDGGETEETVVSWLTDVRHQSPPLSVLSLWEPPQCIVGSCLPAWGVSLPGRRDLAVGAKPPGMGGFEKRMHYGSVPCVVGSGSSAWAVAVASH